MKRIVIIRGGAIGDFILTLPAIRALRDGCPGARIEIVGYKHIAVLAENSGYADAVRSIEYGPLSGFFAKNGHLDDELADYFGSFDLIITYLFDPDQIFATNLGRAGAGRIVCGPSKIVSGSHAARQLAAPVEQLGIEVRNLASKLCATDATTNVVPELRNGLHNRIIALHVGSGSARKNWPLENWIALGNALRDQRAEWDGAPCLVVVSGEADQPQLERLRAVWQDENVRFATNLPLPQLARVLSGCVFVGHDSGISHLAAAVGAECFLLFGPTDPEVWAPQGDHVHVVSATGGELARLGVDRVLAAVIENRCSRLCQPPVS